MTATPITQHTHQPLTAQPSDVTHAEPALQRKILATIAKRSFATLSTTSPAGFPHAAGVVYEAVESTLWIHTLKTSRKARNIEANGRAAMSIAFRRLPAGPPFTIQFQADAETIPMDDQRVSKLAEAGNLKSITGHGELAMPDGVFLAIRPRGAVHSFGLGARVLDIIRDPLNTGARMFRVPE